jgi:hypothetical protein
MRPVASESLTITGLASTAVRQGGLDKVDSDLDVSETGSDADLDIALDDAATTTATAAEDRPLQGDGRYPVIESTA